MATKFCFCLTFQEKMDILGDSTDNMETFDDDEVERLLAMSEKTGEDELELRNTIDFSEDEENTEESRKEIQPPKPIRRPPNRGKRTFQKKVHSYGGQGGQISSKKLSHFKLQHSSFKLG